MVQEIISVVLMILGSIFLIVLIVIASIILAIVLRINKITQNTHRITQLFAEAGLSRTIGYIINYIKRRR